MASTQAATVLQMSGIEKIFPGVRALSDANLEIRAGEVHGLVGENGAGKSTIIKVLAGVYTPEAGEIFVDGVAVPALTPQAVHKLGIRFIHQELHLVPYFTVAESVFMGHELSGRAGLKKREMRARARQILQEQLGVELDPNALIRDISPAQKKLVQVARALTDDDVRLIVFDEPTAPLAAVEVAQVLDAVRRLREQGVASLYVSHYLGEITDLCDRVTVFRNGTDVARLEEVGDHSAREMIKLMTGRDAGELFPPHSVPSETPVLEVRGLGDGAAFSNVDLTVHSGQVLGLAGLLGSGTEELVDSLIGLRRAKVGEVKLGGKPARFASPADALKRGMVLIPRDRRNDGLVLDLSVRDNINLSTLDVAVTGGVFTSAKRAEARAAQMVQELDVRPADTERKVRLLSGGNQQKVVIARALLTNSDVVILDEPTVGVDIGAKAEIYRLIADLASRGTAVLVSSNDPSELLGLCDRVEVMVRGQIVGSYRSAELDRDRLVEVMTASVSAPDANGEQ